MRRLASSLLLGFLAFASYSVTTNYQGTSISEAASAKTTHPKSPSREDAQKPATASRGACVSFENDSLQCAANTFFGDHSVDPSFRLEHNDQVRFVIATLPDPIHTDLALSFDRFVEAMSQGAQEANYTFDHAVLPWPSLKELSEDTKKDSATEVKGSLARMERENTPGLLIFRDAARPKVSKLTQKHLFVLLVGETPTAGINKEQFLRAIDIICKNTFERKCSDSSRIDILGPTFSGSLYSLGVLEHLVRQGHGNVRFRIRSGTVMSGKAITDFACNPLNKEPLDFLTFKDTDQYLIDRFVEFAKTDGIEGYKESDIAVVSEDETAFGTFPDLPSTAATTEQANCAKIDIPPPPHSDVKRIYFPRGIALLRAAYQNDPVLASGRDDSKSPHSKLKLNLDSTGSDDDSVPTYAGTQTALSQEAVMAGIVTVLRVYHPHFIILRATDPKDLLFLTRFFRNNYPEDRIVTMGADQLFPRDVDDTIFRGVLSLTNYPLLPTQLTDFIDPQPHRVFPSTENAGLFNATLDLLDEAKESDPLSEAQGPEIKAINELNGAEGAQNNDKTQNIERENARTSIVLPKARYFEYSAPFFDADPSPLNKLQRPAAWLTVMGSDGYWPLATLPDADSCSKQPAHPDLTTVSLECRLFGGCDPCDVTTPPRNLRFAAAAAPRGISLHPSRFNELVILGLCVLALIFMYLTWFGDFRSRSTLHQQLAMLSDKTRGWLVGAVSLSIMMALVSLASPFTSMNRWPPIVVSGVFVIVAISTVFNLRLRGRSWAAVTLAFAAVLLAFPLFWLTRAHHSVRESLLLYRMAWLQSGVSPVVPLLLICAAVLCWAWFNLKLRSLFDLRYPVLPRGIPALPSSDSYAGDEYARVFTRNPVFWLGAALVLAVVVVQDMDPLSLDGTNFNDLFRTAFLVCLILVANSTFAAWETWKKCRTLLLQLDRTPLRWAFRRIEGFSWKPLWGAAGGDLMGAYKPLSRSLESFKHLRSSLSEAQSPYFKNRAALMEGDLVQLRSSLAKPTVFSQTSQLRTTHDALVYRMHTLQKNLALACSLVWLALLEKLWESDTRLVTTGKQIRVQNAGASKKSSSAEPGESDPEEQDHLSAENQSTRLAEEFISLVYLNFIHRVLLRLRWLILAATCTYVLLLFSMKLYPFEPQGHIDGLLILLFLCIAAAIYMIYSQMHRDSTLSHLTKTNPGELGMDFWIRIVSIGAVPLFSLLATQVPTLNRFFYSWLKPILDAVHRS